MRTSSFLALLPAFVANVLANHVLHEKRFAPPPDWHNKASLDPDSVIPLKFALQQTNMHLAEKYLYEVSHPRSEKYGQHWTPKKVAETFRASDESVQTVKNWLIGEGIHPDRIHMTPSMSWIHVNTTIPEAEYLLKTEYFKYEHAITGVPQVACHEYHLPQHIAGHVDFVTPTVHFDTPLNIKHRRQAPPLPKRKQPIHKQTIRRRTIPTIAEALEREEKYKDVEIPRLQKGSAAAVGVQMGFRPKPGATLADDAEIQGLDNCDQRITPACLRALYGFEVPKGSPHPKNSYGIVEYSPQSYVQTDLDKYFSNFSSEAKGMQPLLQSINGGVLLPANRSFNVNGESNLDLEVAMAIVAPMKVTLYEVGDAVQGASFNNFLDAVDKGYCDFNGGDDKEEDAVYPDPPEGYIGPANCGGYVASKVISTSYGYNEADLTPVYVKRQCAEYLKLALQGVTVLYSSGDFGVAGNMGRCIVPDSMNYTQTNATSGVFNPSFPSGCPWVTSVGATEVKAGTNIVRMLEQNKQPEVACEKVIRSGGGFSNVFEMPEYQQTLVKRWFSDHPPYYGADRFNNSQRTRGFPDLSVNGANYVVSVNSSFSLIFGTSASAPALGGMLALINQERLSAGKTTIGFINPVLYENPNMLRDVTEGKNFGCGTDGFQASEGWDPATGLGTPIYSEMLDVFMALP